MYKSPALLIHSLFTLT
uniref:Uncharacterized protein n=1 Tax=Romanomermis culicivorax TaxID=13658 RepID=A0A915KA30_ROMCU